MRAFEEPFLSFLALWVLWTFDLQSWTFGVGEGAPGAFLPMWVPAVEFRLLTWGEAQLPPSWITLQGLGFNGEFVPQPLFPPSMWTFCL